MSEYKYNKNKNMNTILQTPQIDELHKVVDGRVVAKTCKYDNNTPAIKACSDCGTGLCSFCGYNKDGKVLCNECYNERQEDETSECWYCGELLEAIYENNGFTEPAGPSHWEIVGWKKCQCGVGGGH